MESNTTPKPTRHTGGIVTLANGRVIRLSDENPMYRITKMINGKQYAYLGYTEEECIKWYENN